VSNDTANAPTMRAIEIAGPGGPEVLRAVVRARPVAGAGEALVRVTASGVNRPDVLQRKGHYAPPPGASDLPGLEFAGVIEGGDAAALAAGGFRVGDRVCALVAGGGYAEYCTVPVGQMLPVPAGFSDVEAAALPENFFTVWSNVFDRGRLAAGQWLLVQGGTSGIGVTAIQLGKVFGAKVIATAGSAEKCARCIELGADHAVDYRSEDFAARALEITGGQGVDVVLDMVAGGDYVAREVSCMAEDGRIVIIAVQGGTKAQFDAGVVMRKRLTLTGSTLRPRPVAFKAAIAAALREKVWPLLERRQVLPVIQEVFPAEQASRAHTAMEEGRHVGKLMLSWV
jgi:putative PIG3 family NAD(P)H quinone oxidoreductase